MRAQVLGRYAAVYEDVLLEVDVTVIVDGGLKTYERLTQTIGKREGPLAVDLPKSAKHEGPVVVGAFLGFVAKQDCKRSMIGLTLDQGLLTLFSPNTRRKAPFM